MKKRQIIAALAILIAAADACDKASQTPASSLTPPSWPLVTIDPYTSAWSPADRLYDAGVEHWTGMPFPFVGVLTVDGTEYRFLGKEKAEEYKAICHAGLDRHWDGFYTTKDPAKGWMNPEFSMDPSWIRSQGGYGPENRKPLTATWIDAEDIWARRDVDIETIPDEAEVFFQANCQNINEYYVNGIAVPVADGSHSREYIPLPAAARESLKSGRAVLAGHSHSFSDNRKVGNALVDMGLYVRNTYAQKYDMTAVQTSATVLPTRTNYGFDCGPVALELSFVAPFLLDDLDLTSRPVNYIVYAVSTKDGQKHDVSIRIEAGAEWAQNYPMDEVAVSETFEKNGITYARTGNIDQTILSRSGDNVRIDWGYFYLAAESQGTAASALPAGDVAIERTLGKVKKGNGKIMIGYDDLYSIRYFGTDLRPWWNSDGTKTIEGEFEAACRDYKAIMKRSCGFDASMMAEAAAAGGQKYAELCALAYRQCIAAHKLVKSPSGELLLISKENNSNGSAGTVDVTYPSAPLFLKYNPELAKGLLNFIFDYSENHGWDKPFACHDIGRYPLCEGQYYGADMPVEECGNMLTLAAAICHFSGDASYARRHWETLTKWTEYLSQFGLDPDNQLCTDDFAGHSAHNANLSIKAIMGIASYARMADMLGDAQTSDKYAAMARSMAQEWVKLADDGDHYRLNFDAPGTWSQKYNLVWDSLLGLNVFETDIMAKEIPYYIGIQRQYGLPLDNRSEYTKTDWILWTAAMCRTQEDFDALVDPVWRFYDESVDRVPMSDWTWTDKAEHRGFKARSVVGGFFMKMLFEK
ncbi:MAG: DUF4965 domain-containing protein [Bacteroidales bacterium]|nr:DUF4965 domain-containing protein [Bacteroidales bacterium]